MAEAVAKSPESVVWEEERLCEQAAKIGKGLRGLRRAAVLVVGPLLPSDEVITLRQVGGVLGAVLQLCSIRLEIPLVHSPGPPTGLSSHDLTGMDPLLSERREEDECH
ncbi:hypothetical protein Q5P01_025562 [Channa striata]|uniref:Uncharacterized protein n=1 Tax=Channa striata TaxID=64152 RepID=A0AA88ING8_CHASR|nr:hypothetical protein Q5P01_025562 [Channa striata]